MKHPIVRLTAILVLSSAIFAHGATLYVDLNSADPTPPYSDWSTAATNIQDAIDASSDGDQIWVTNGVYQSGGRVMAGNLTNRVALNKAVTVQSVNGPFVTVIAGAGAVNGNSAIRCAWLTNNAALTGFTLTQGATLSSGDVPSLQSGGGAWCASSNASVTSCVIVSNTASSLGGAAFQGTLNSCAVMWNGATSLSAGAINSANVNNCTVISNSVAGTSGGHITNSIVYYNIFGNHSGGIFSYCCVTPAAGGAGNFTNAPQLLSDGIHLSSTSPCIGTGTTPAAGADIFGNPWANPPSIGCFEAASIPFVAQPQIQLTGTPVGFTIGNTPLSGQGPFTFQWLKDGAPLQDNGHFSFTQAANLVASGISFADAGNYQLVVSNTFGTTTSVVAQVVIHCVDPANPNPVAPYTNWVTAATNIQDAITAAAAGEIVLATNGIYAAGGKVMVGDLTNRVALDKAITVISANGFANTIIEGQWDSTSTNGPGAVRCAWLTNGATLAGFTLRNGATRGGNSGTSDLQFGGGGWLSSNAVISDCVLSNNCADFEGGGVVQGTVNNSFLYYNTSQNGGGAYEARLNNCTIRENHCFISSGGAGIDTCIAHNCIISGNYYSPFGVFDYQLANYSFTSFNKFTNCCTSPLPSQGAGNTAANPVFLDPGFHLAPASPCRGTGNSLYATGNDLDGEPFGNPPSIGCDEIVEANLTGPLSISFVRPWTEFLVNHSVAFQSEIDGHVSEIEWSFGDGTVVTNAGYFPSHTWTNVGTYVITLTVYNHDHPEGVSSNFSVIVDPMISPQLASVGMVSNSFQFTFPGQTNALYLLQYTTNLVAPVNWQILGSTFSTGGVITIQDSAITNAARFYRVQEL